MKPQVSAFLSTSWRRLQTRVRTRWHPLQVSLRPDSPQTEPGQWLPAMDGALSTWSDWCVQHPGACAELSLSAHWLLVAVAEDPLAIWQHYYGITIDEFDRDWVLRSVQVGTSQLHCAAPKSMISGLLSAARANGVRIQWAGPWWIRHLEQHVSEQIKQSDRGQDWTVQEPGLRIHASLSWNDSNPSQVGLSQVWCEAEFT